MTQTRARARIAYYSSVAIAIGMAGLAGMVLIADHPELDGLDIRLVAATVFAVSARFGLVAARESWCRAHGISPLEIELGWLDDDDSE